MQKKKNKKKIDINNIEEEMDNEEMTEDKNTGEEEIIDAEPADAPDESAAMFQQAGSENARLAAHGGPWKRP